MGKINSMKGTKINNETRESLQINNQRMLNPEHNPVQPDSITRRITFFVSFVLLVVNTLIWLCVGNHSKFNIEKKTAMLSVFISPGRVENLSIRGINR